MAKSLILTLKTDTEIILVKDIKTQEIQIGDAKYEVVLKNLSFTKKMYEPGHITANIQFKLSGGTKWKAISKQNLDTTFKSVKAELAYGEATKGADGKWTINDKATICSSYYIHELNPSYKTDSLFVTMNIYSVDKQMTLSKNSKSWVAKRLCRDIVEMEKGNYKLPYDQNNLLTYDYNHLQILKCEGDSKEEIFPYLVQYNESYYDFLVRTCNRWGEFLYYEGDTLHIGYDESKEAREISTYDTLTYCDLNEKLLSAENISTSYADGTTHDTTLLETPLKKGKYNSVKAVIGSDFENGGDIWLTKIIGNLLSSGKNMFDFAVDTVVDELIAKSQAETFSNKLNNEFDNNYFKEDDIKDEVKGGQYKDHEGMQFFEYALADTHIKSENYKAVVMGELRAAKDAVCINFDTSYQDLKLGDCFTVKDCATTYIVVEVGTKENSKLIVENGEVKTTSTTTYYIVGTAEYKKLFYPTVHPAGHIRTSGPQRGKVIKASTGDPLRQGRVKVMFPWQTGSDDETPWIEFARPGGNVNTGTYNRHYENEEVLVAFANDNLERPYVLGALSTGKQTTPMASYGCDILHITPGGQAIKMTDGLGSDFSSFLANMIPGMKLVTGYLPGFQLPGLDFEASKSFEGSIELGDKYGIYSIKGSTDGRNVSIKSPFGDINLNAFTGITISAPNGDVKIQGKNVTIEAGNNLSLVSGKNIKNGFFCSYRKDSFQGSDILMTFGAAVTKKLESMVGGFFDLSLARHFVEVFMRPLEGKLQVKSNRYLALEAGNGKTDYPVDAYNRSDYHHWGIKYWRSISSIRAQAEKDNSTINDFNQVGTIATDTMSAFIERYNGARGGRQSLHDKIVLFTKVTQDENIPPCNTLEQLLDAAWGNDEIGNNTMGFKGMLADAASAENLTEDMIKFFVDDYTGNESEEQKNAKRTNAFQLYQHAREDLKNTLITIKQNITELKNFSLAGRVDTITKAEARNACEAGDFLDGSFFKTMVNDVNYKHFINTIDVETNEKVRKQLRRKIYQTLITTFGFERTATGGIAGIGATVPEAPNPFDDNIEAKWNSYVNSIQAMPKLRNPETPVKDLLQNTMGDPFFNNSIFNLINDARDNLAFGIGSKGKILFSNGSGTMVLDKDIARANTDNAEDADINGHITGNVSSIRNLMNE